MAASVKDQPVKVLNMASGDNFVTYNGDCVEVLAGIPDESVGYSIFSPPFASLYVYSNSERDMGNSASYEEFFTHFVFVIDHLLRVLKPGRLVSVHCMNLPTTIQHHGEIGIQDFRGDIIREFKARSFIYHSEVCIWKDPVTAMQRTKALGLLHKQIVKDSCMSRMGIPDYLCTFRKPGKNAEPVAGEFDRFIGDASTFERTGKLSIDVWQRYASPVWMDINPSRVLPYTTAREENDERHICPLQLDVIERGMEMWSNEGDTVLSPYGGVGSEGVVAVEFGRKSISIELKESYWKHNVANHKAAEKRWKESGRGLFDGKGVESEPPAAEFTPDDHRPPASVRFLACGHPNEDDNWDHHFGCVACDCGAKPELQPAGVSDAGNPDLDDI